MYTIVTSPRFLRRAARFFRQHPDLRGRFERMMTALREDPHQPQLRLHPLRGELEGLHAASLTYEYRVLLTLQITEQEIVLLDIGTHDELYR